MTKELQKLHKFMKISNKNKPKRLRNKSGNNPCYNYPSIPPPLHSDPKYKKGKDISTKFAEHGSDGVKHVNLLETVGKLQILHLFSRKAVWIPKAKI